MRSADVCALLWPVRACSGLIGSRVEFGDSSAAAPFNDCQVFSFLAQFCSVGAEGYFLMLSVDLVVTITNPFSNYTVRAPPAPLAAHAQKNCAWTCAANLHRTCTGVAASWSHAICFVVVCHTCRAT